VAELRVFLDANILFTAAYSPDGLSALLIELGAAGRVTLLTSPLAIVEAERNLEAKRPSCAAHPAREPYRRSSRQRTGARRRRAADASGLIFEGSALLAAAIVAHATHFVTGDVADFGRWMDRRARLPLRVMTPRQFLTEVHP
jgi:predicted nucleic acid-binding protein